MTMTTTTATTTQRMMILLRTGRHFFLKSTCCSLALAPNSLARLRPCTRRLFFASTSSTFRDSSSSSTARSNDNNFDDDVDDDDVDHLFQATAGNLPLRRRYFEMVQQHNVEADPVQLEALESLERLRAQLVTTEPSPRKTKTTKTATTTTAASHTRHHDTRQSSGYSFSSWFSGSSSSASSSSSSSQLTATATAPRGVYLHGGVGCGKTFLMNLFYDSLDPADSLASTVWSHERQKIHFHRFMLNIHQYMHEARQQQQQGHDIHTIGSGHHHTHHHKDMLQSDAILPHVIERVLSNGRLICLDEFQVTDVADAMILQRLFTGLWHQGAVVVATSNRPPQDLYLNGLQRDRFLPFIDVLQHYCQVVSLWDSDTDYRLLQKLIAGERAVYFSGPGDPYNNMDRLFYELVQNSAVAPTTLQTQSGRRVAIPQASLRKGIARFRFDDLCQKALGAADYLLIGQHFHTVFVEQIPRLSINELNWIRRFITFVDSMYESNVKLILHTAQSNTPMNELLQLDDNRSGDDKNKGKLVHDELFAFDRTISRLQEMASQTYLQKRWTGGGLRPDTGVDVHGQNDAVIGVGVNVQPSVSDCRDNQKRFV